MTRALTRRSILELIEEHPDVNTHVHVVGTSMQSKGVFHSIADVLVPATTGFANKVIQLELKLRPQVSITTSSPKLAIYLRSELGSNKIHFKTSADARDLGIDHNAATRRPTEIYQLEC